jgi:hypothetical protein
VGCAVLTTKKNANGQVVMPDGTVAAKNEKKKGGVLDVCFPPGATSPIVNQGAAAAAGAGAGATTTAVGGGGGLFGIGAPLTVVVIAASTITLAQIIAVGGDSNQNIVSPSRP